VTRGGTTLRKNEDTQQSRRLEKAPEPHTADLRLSPVAWTSLGVSPYLLSGKRRVGGPEKWLGPGPGLQDQKGLRSGAQRGVGRGVVAHLLHTKVLRGIQELQGCWQIGGVQASWVTAH
jgi:hypothetical protein